MPQHLTSNDESIIKTKVYVSGVLMPRYTVAFESAVVANGKCVFDVRKKDGNGTRTEVSCFDAMIYPESVMPIAWSSTRQLSFANPVLSSDRKTVTVDVSTQSINILNGLITLSAAPNGTTVTAQIGGR